MQATMKTPPEWNLRADSAFFSRAKKVANRALILYGETHENVSPPVIIVPKTTSAKAVGRHLLKRRLKAILKELPTRPAKCVVVAKRSATNLDFESLKESISHLVSLW